MESKQELEKQKRILENMQKVEKEHMDPMELSDEELDELLNVYSNLIREKTTTIQDRVERIHDLEKENKELRQKLKGE